MSVRLSDLDELALTVRDKQSQSYILEAVSAYRGGAYRSAIISTWVAVTYDIIAKIRELAGKNDKAATAFVQELETAITNRNISQMQRIEEGVLDKAAKEFELLAEHELTDIQRLKDDRNQCAHPAFISEAVLFEPSPELVRTHIVHAITHLLQHQPVQGKGALARIMVDLQQPSFPLTADGVYTYLAEKYLNRAKIALVRNLIGILLKTLLKEDLGSVEAQKQKLLCCILAVSRSHSLIYEQEMASRLATLLSGLEDNQRFRVYWLLSIDPRCWQWMPNSDRILLKNYTEYVASFPKGAGVLLVKYSVFNAMAIPEISSFLMDVFLKLGDDDQSLVVASSPRPEFTAAVIEKYAASGSFRVAESHGNTLILPLAQHFTPSQIAEILKAAHQNYQIQHANGTSAILNALFDLTRAKLPETGPFWKAYVEPGQLEVDRYGYRSYPGLINRLIEAGVIARPEEGQEESS
ncbi:MAG: hypothetical protein U0X20_26045 [Caldilineaceae bacterium]